MAKHKKHKCICKICFKSFRSKDKFKNLCPEHSKTEEELEVDNEVDDLYEPFDDVDRF